MDRVHQKGQESRVHPALRLCLVIFSIVLLSLSRNAFFAVSILAAALLLTALLPAKEIRRVLSALPVPAALTFLVMLPAVFLGSPGTLLTVTLKVTLSVLLLSLYNERTAWKETTGAMAAFHAPDLFIMTLDTTVRFLVILGRFAGRMLEAVSLRRVGKKTWKNAGTGGILGTTWLKSQQMVRENMEAMTCRCFDGTYQKMGERPRDPREKRKRVISNLLFSLLFPVLLAFFLYTEKIL